MEPLNKSIHGLFQRRKAKTRFPLCFIFNGLSPKPIPEEDIEKYLSELPGRIDDMFMAGQTAKIEQAIQQMFLGFQNRDLSIRQKVIGICHSLLDNLTATYQHDIAKILAEPLMEAKVFPDMVVQMIGVGEQTGALDQMLNKYDPDSLQDGWNTVGDERLFFVRNPALGLWAYRGRFEEM